MPYEYWDAHQYANSAVALYATTFPVKVYGAVGDGSTNDTAAIQAAINAAAPSQGIVAFENKTYAYGALDLSAAKGVTFQGTHVPSADAATPATGTTLLRTVNSVGVTIRGTNRTTNRIGANRFSGIRFKETADVSALPTFDCKYADSLVFENVTFWQNDTTTTWGHAIAAEECWDWRFDNVIQKGCGSTAASKYGIYVLNGATDSCNDWRFAKSRFQEPNGLVIYFDSSGGGQPNKLFDFVQCKFEDARTPSIPDLYIDGDAQEVTFTSCLFAGSPLLKHVNITSASVDWKFVANTHVGVATATGVASVDVAGSRCKFIGVHFNSGGLPQLLKITGADNAVIGCTQSGTTNAFNAGIPASTVILSPQLGGTALALAPGSTGSKGLVLNAPTGQSVDIFDVQLNAISKLKVVSGGGITVSATLTLADTINIAANTTTGSKLGTGTTQKLGFWNATPVVQPSGSSDVLASLVSVGLRAASSNPPLDLGTGAVTAGSLSMTPTATGNVQFLLNAPSGQSANIFDVQLNGATKLKVVSGGGITVSATLTLADTINIAANTTTGSKIGTATSQKLGFWNATPIVQPTTAGAAATRVGGGGTALTDSDTFDGYTVAQVVKALRSMGTLA